MEILKTLSTEQSIKVIPRELTTDVHFYLVDKEQERNVIDENLSGARIWQGLALCTDKTDLQEYKIYE